MGALMRLMLGAVGVPRSATIPGDTTRRIMLPPPQLDLPGTLMQALRHRRSERAFRGEPLARQTLADLLWVADGVNRENGERTAPSALGAHETLIVVAMAEGTYGYDPCAHALNLMVETDIRRQLSGYQIFVADAPLDLVYVADHGRMARVPAHYRDSFASVAVGAISQNVALYCAANGLATVLRAWIDREAIASALRLGAQQHVLMSQTVGRPA